MSGEYDGGSAFPRDAQVLKYDWGHTNGNTKTVIGPSYGMSLRDWFAGHALAGLTVTRVGDHGAGYYAVQAYALADAMLAARK